MPLIVILLFFSGGVLYNSGEAVADLDCHPVILCSVEALPSLLAGNADNPFSSQTSVRSASVDRLMLHWVSLLSGQAQTCGVCGSCLQCPDLHP